MFRSFELRFFQSGVPSASSWSWVSLEVLRNLLCGHFGGHTSSSSWSSVRLQHSRFGPSCYFRGQSGSSPERRHSVGSSCSGAALCRSGGRCRKGPTMSYHHVVGSTFAIAPARVAFALALESLVVARPAALPLRLQLAVLAAAAADAVAATAASAAAALACVAATWVVRSMLLLVPSPLPRSVLVPLLLLARRLLKTVADAAASAMRGALLFLWLLTPILWPLLADVRRGTCWFSYYYSFSYLCPSE